MITLALMIAAAVPLAIALPAARRAAIRQLKLERDNEAMKRQLDRHHEVARSILEELQNA